jgi:DNA-binding CsgD family transcriptional regulator
MGNHDSSRFPAHSQADAYDSLKTAAASPLKHGMQLRAQIEFLLLMVGLQTREIAYACGVTRQTVRNWRKTTDLPRELRYTDLRMVVDRMVGAGVEPRLVGAWLRARDRGLGYVPPLDAIRARRFGDVIASADAFIAGSSLPVALPSRYLPSRETVAPDDPDQELQQILAGRSQNSD